MNATAEWLTSQVINRTRQERASKPSELLAIATTTVVKLGIADAASILDQSSEWELNTVVATEAGAANADREQLELGEGPSLTALRDKTAVWSNDVEADPRWPRWGQSAALQEVAAVVSVQLYVADETLGSLNLFYKHNVSTYDLEVAQAIAVPISVQLAHYHHEQRLWEVIEDRHRIGQAQGILMERFHTPEDAAFSSLREYCEMENAEMETVAGRIVRTGVVPGRLEKCAQDLNFAFRHGEGPARDRYANS